MPTVSAVSNASFKLPACEQTQINREKKKNGKKMTITSKSTTRIFTRVTEMRPRQDRQEALVHRMASYTQRRYSHAVGSPHATRPPAGQASGTYWGKNNPGAKNSAVRVETNPG